MIKYNLECECGHTFESWFLNSTKYESLIKKKLINCVKCSSTKVKKTLMTPNLSGKSNKVKKNNKIEKIVKKELVKFRKYIEKNCQDVGDNFTQEARSIHYDKKNRPMAFFNLDCLGGQAEAIIFHDAFDKYKAHCLQP